MTASPMDTRRRVLVKVFVEKRRVLWTVQKASQVIDLRKLGVWCAFRPHMQFIELECRDRKNEIVRKAKLSCQTSNEVFAVGDRLSGESVRVSFQCIRAPGVT